MFKENVEVRISSVILGILALGCAVFIFRSDAPESLFADVNDTLELWLAWVMVVTGSMQIFGSCKPKRKIRQYGLILSSIAWFVLFGVLLTEWQLRVGSILILVFGIATFLAYVEDVRRKPREECTPR